VKGGAFDATDEDYYRWVVGSGTTIGALDEAIKYAKEGAVMQVIVPAELGYPKGDPDHDIVGPK
jgi:FKBP-type peptidyl-prolyl cis-trans isomerase 2